MKPNFGCMSSEGGIDGLGVPLESSINTVFAIPGCKNACIIIFHSAAIAIKYDTHSDRYSVFDPHSRGENGLCTPNGKAIVSVLNSLQNLCSFLRNLCISLCGTFPLHQVQYELCSFQISYSKKGKRGAIDLDCDLRDLVAKNDDLLLTHYLSDFDSCSQIHVLQNDKFCLQMKRANMHVYPRNLQAILF